MEQRVETDASVGTAAVDRLISEWESQGTVKRLWAGDPAVWTGNDEDRWLGWLRVASGQLTQLGMFQRLAEEVAAAGLTHAVLLGMGGSSLCADVLNRCLSRRSGAPVFSVLDSTDPAQVRAVERSVDLARTLFLVSSKSGTTLEPTIFCDYFFERVRTVVGETAAGRQFVAVTDPGSALERRATESGFRSVFHGIPSIGGRYSALSHFGMVPAAVMGLDVGEIIRRAARMESSCGSDVPLRQNPGAMLGLTLGAAARQGRDKVTVITSPSVGALGAWLEQLIAESTGKQGTGLIPVESEQLGPPASYGADRFFVYVRDASAPDTDQDTGVERLEASGQPVVRLSLQDPYDLGAEFFRWEFATAVAGAVLGINPFDQPDVEASKVETRRLTEAYEREGRLPVEEPIVREGSIAVFLDPLNRQTLLSAVNASSVEAWLAAHLTRLQPGDYFTVLAYVEMSPEHETILQRLRHTVRDRCTAATAVGYGPRFLHSTGQAHKGGPDTGVFLQITCDDPADLDVPGRRFSFGVVKTAQARGDLEVLVARKRRVLRLHLTGDVTDGLRRITELVTHALPQTR